MTKKYLWDKYVSPYIRQRDATDYGKVKCISCNEWKNVSEVDAGHFIPKARGMAVYFEEDNLWPQCRKCNRFGSNDTGYIFGENVKRKLGQERFERLYQLSKTTLSPSDAKLLLKQAELYYKEKAKNL